MKFVGTRMTKLPDKQDIQQAHNETLDSLAKIQNKETAPTGVSPQLEQKLTELKKEGEDRHKELVKTVSEMGDMTETLMDNFGKSYEELRNEIQAIGRVEQVMMQTADGVLDTKRRVEYGVHQILLEVGELVKLHTKDINGTINERFDNFELSILDEDTGALANLTSKIGKEIDQVWRQIGIMHQQMSASTDTLNKLQNQTDAYVNGTYNVMDNMKGKVSFELHFTEIIFVKYQRVFSLEIRLMQNK